MEKRRADDPALDVILAIFDGFKALPEAFGGAAIFTLIAALVATMGAIYSPWLGVTGAVLAAFGSVWSAREQNQAAKELTKKNEEIVRLSMQVANSVTGGPAACYITPYGGHASLGMLVAFGDYPLYELKARIVDLELFDQHVAAKKPFTLTGPKPFEKTITIGEVGPHMASMLGDLFALHGENRNWNIFFSARNGFFTQLLRMKKVNGQWLSAIRVTRQPDSTKEPIVIHEKIADGFGDVKW